MPRDPSDLLPRSIDANVQLPHWNAAVRAHGLIAALVLAGCATTPPPSRWERLSGIDERVIFELDRNSLARRGVAATALVRTAYFEASRTRPPFAPHLFFDQPYQFSCSDRSFILMESRSYTAATGKWRDWPGIDEPKKVDVGARTTGSPN